jgi:hypothetical protein
MRPLHENGRRIPEETTMVVVAMAEMTDTRLARLESDVTHLKSDVAYIKTDVREIRTNLGGLRDDVRKEFAELHREIAANGKAIIRGDLMNRVWTLLICAAMLGVVARGLHWL